MKVKSLPKRLNCVKVFASILLQGQKLLHVVDKREREKFGGKSDMCAYVCVCVCLCMYDCVYVCTVHLFLL